MEMIENQTDRDDIVPLAVVAHMPSPAVGITAELLDVIFSRLRAGGMRPFTTVDVTIIEFKARRRSVALHVGGDGDLLRCYHRVISPLSII
jgi:hypothetical protein